MRCQAGDLALVISGHDRSIGTMVTCVRLMRLDETVTIGGFSHGLPTGPACWLVDPPVRWRLQIETDSGVIERYVPAPYCADCCLMPVRPERDDAEADHAAKEMAT